MRKIKMGNKLSNRGIIGDQKATLIRALLFSAIAVVPVVSSSVLANTSIDEIIVTASKREQTLQETPIAVSVVGKQEITRASVSGISDLQILLPSLRVTTVQTSAGQNLNIRGFGNGSNNTGIEPSVGVFIDGVYRSRAGSQIGDLPRLERIEVLRGPQSTLFGKNASAGVLSIVTAAPSFETVRSVEAELGNYNQRKFKGYISTGLTDKLAISFSAGHNMRDGYTERLDDGKALGNRDRWNLRGQALWEVNDDTSVRIIADQSELNEVCCAVSNIINGPTAFAIQALGGTVLSPDEPFAYESAVSTDPFNKIKDGGISAQVDIDYDGFSVTSITAKRTSEGSSGGDVDFTSLDIVKTGGATKIDTFTQELRATSNGEGALSWMVGGYYFDETIEQTGYTDFGDDIRIYADALFGGPAAIAGAEFYSGLAPGSVLSTDILTGMGFDQDNQAYSVFASVDYSLSDALVATFGLNYTNDKKDVAAYNTFNNDTYSNTDLTATLTGTPLAPFIPSLQGLQFRPLFLDFPNVVEDGKSDDSKTTWTARLAYEVNDALNVYVTAATGFKGTSWNLGGDARPFAVDQQALGEAGLLQINQTFGTRYAEPEKAMVLEVGMKGRFERGTYNVAIFDQSIEDFQANAFNGTGFVLSNAGEVSSKGIEFDVTYAATDALIFNLAGTIMDPIYDEYVGASGPNGVVVDLSGEKPSGISERNFTGSVTYQFAMDGGIEGYVRADYIHESKTRTATNVPEALTREVGTAGASAGVEFPNGVNMRLWARNLNGDEYFTGAFPGVVQAGTFNIFPNEPRMFGLTVSTEF
jgi:iron complex outermembrane receptor protein